MQFYVNYWIKLLNCFSLILAPLEYLTLAFDMPYMLLLGDIRQGVFYAVLLSFWLVFAGEHMLVSMVWFEYDRL